MVPARTRTLPTLRSSAPSSTGCCAASHRWVYGTGEQTRDFISVQDVAQANLLALAAETQGFTALNIATGQARSVLELVETLNTLCQTRLSPQFAPPRPG
ncbi:MAG: hypothetical protein KatS3mg061_2889 [Dehalococcoidia bacterium]|nr:MAG: hypothetical protein KatS3mg061_2889 [Dehalococcoidia bacterium]